MAKSTKQDRETAGTMQASGGALLAAILQHLINAIPGFEEIVESEFFSKSTETNGDTFSLSLVFLQNYRTPNQELDELVLAQVMIFLANEKKLALVPEIIVNMTGSDFGGN